MISLSEITFSGPGRAIEGYGPGFFRIGGERCPAPLLVTDQGVLPWGGLSDHTGLLALRGKVDVLLLGMGPTIAYPDAALKLSLAEAGLGLEPMASASAARTFNMLLAEGRRVAAALLPAV